MGFPDGYTLVPYRGKPAELCADSPRYKALGNSIVVPVLRWIGERIAMVDALPAAELVHPEDLAKTLSDSELVEKCVQGFRGLQGDHPVPARGSRPLRAAGTPCPGSGQPDVDGVGRDQPARHRAPRAAAIERGDGTSRNNFAKFQAAAEAAQRRLARPAQGDRAQNGAGVRLRRRPQAACWRRSAISHRA